MCVIFSILPYTEYSVKIIAFRLLIAFLAIEVENRREKEHQYVAYRESPRMCRIRKGETAFQINAR